MFYNKAYCCFNYVLVWILRIQQIFLPKLKLYYVLIADDLFIFNFYTQTYYYTFLMHTKIKNT